MNTSYPKTSKFSSYSPLKILIALHVSIGLLFPLLSPFFSLWKLPPLPLVFSLSLWGIKQHFYWQWLTHFLIPPFSSKIDFSLLLYLFFNMYFLYSVGSSVSERKGIRHFLALYLGGGLISGLAVSCFLSWTHSPDIICGISPALYALLAAWMMLVPNMQILLFLMFPIRIKWLIVGILGANLAIALSNAQWTTFILYLSSIGFGYLYAVMSWETYSPFAFLHGLESLLIKLSRVTGKLCRPYSRSSSQKIYDIRDAQALYKDEEFMNACLSKIAREGKESLSLIERWKMRKISKKLRRKFDS